MSLNIHPLQATALVVAISLVAAVVSLRERAIEGELWWASKIWIYCLLQLAVGWLATTLAPSWFGDMESFLKMRVWGNGMFALASWMYTLALLPVFRGAIALVYRPRVEP